MTNLVSPGASISVTNEAYYTSAAPGTVPLFVVATADNKTAPSGTGVAPNTVPPGNTLYLTTGQRDLIQNYGNPIFHTLNGTPLHGHELNEYGLQAAYSYLGVNSEAYILRADIDLSALMPSVSAPVGAPVNGTLWLDLANTKFGVFESNGDALAATAWTNQTVLTPNAAQISGVGANAAPLTSYGSNGNFAIVTETTLNYLWQKISGTWYRVGSSSWLAANPTLMTGSTSPSLPANGTVMSINNTTVTFNNASNIATVANQINSANVANVTATVTGSNAVQLSNNVGGNLSVTGNAAYTLGFISAANATSVSNGVTVQYTNTPQYPSGTAAGSVWVKLSSPNNGANWVLKSYNSATGQWSVLPTLFYPYSAMLSDGNASKDAAALTALPHPVVGYTYVGFDNANQAMEVRYWDGTKYVTGSYEALSIAPTTDPAAGTYWYNTDFAVDVMYGDGTKWYGYLNQYPNADPNGPIIDGSAPTAQSDGTPLVDGDIWIDSSDLENYPRIYRWSTTTLRWVLVNNTDNTSPFGIIFADARADAGPISLYGSNHTTANSTVAGQLGLSNFCDPDCPDPREYPAGMLLFNTRASTYNVKQWNPTYFNAGGFDPNTDFTQVTYNVGAETFNAVTSAARWTTASGNKADGSPYMGRKAQRTMVVRAMADALNTNEEIRAEINYFNLICAPGYTELLSEMVNLNTDIKEVAFIVGDVPCRVAPTGSAIQNWATNSKNTTVDGDDGLVTSDTNTALYYPWGLTTNWDGNSIMVPPSAMAMVVYANNDNVAQPWFAPAGFNRGMVTNASSVGYLNAAGQYQPVKLNQGQRDVLYTNSINPIAYMPGRGLVVFGQKTLTTIASALDRVNVSRLICYLRYVLDNAVKPFLFQQNDAQTQLSAQTTIDRLLLQLVGQRALYDYAVVCDSTNNTPAIVDQNELYIDIAISPEKSIEFIYIPIRIENTGTDLSSFV